jgi:hypothetical protein
MEKSWAKLMGNFKHISGGNVGEVLRALTGAPSDFVGIDNLGSASATWDLLVDGVSKGWIMAALTGGTSDTL